MPSSLINFNVPVVVRKRFDAVCRASGRSRTSVLLELMTNYVLEEGKRIEERDRQLGDFDISLQESQGLMGSTREMYNHHQSTVSLRHNCGDKEFDLPDPIFSDGRGDW
jgi:hypothetical protein